MKLSVKFNLYHKRPVKPTGIRSSCKPLMRPRLYVQQQTCQPPELLNVLEMHRKREREFLNEPGVNEGSFRAMRWNIRSGVLTLKAACRLLVLGTQDMGNTTY
jgi:hypothetical protein